MSERGRKLLDVIYDDVDHRLNPNGDECWLCGGEGVTYSCFEEWACIDPEGGCSECETPCLECRIYAGQRAKGVREEVIRSGDIDIAIAWLKDIGRWRDDITPEQVRTELTSAAADIASPVAASSDPDESSMP